MVGEKLEVVFPRNKVSEIDCLLYVCMNCLIWTSLQSLNCYELIEVPVATLAVSSGKSSPWLPFQHFPNGYSLICFLVLSQVFLCTQHWPYCTDMAEYYRKEAKIFDFGSIFNGRTTYVQWTICCIFSPKKETVHSGECDPGECALGCHIWCSYCKACSF